MGDLVSRFDARLAQRQIRALQPEPVHELAESDEDQLRNFIVFLFSWRQFDQLSLEQFTLSRRVRQLLEFLEREQGRACAHGCPYLTTPACFMIGSALRRISAATCCGSPF